jgi:hypothetical protein
MTTTQPESKTESKKSASQPLYEPFPEPQTYPKLWDGTALENLARPKPGKTKAKPKPQA